MWVCVGVRMGVVGWGWVCVWEVCMGIRRGEDGSVGMGGFGYWSM